MRKVTPEDKILFACIRQNFLDKHRQMVVDTCRREAIDWRVLYSTAKLHGVAPLVYTNLKRCCLPSLNIPQNILSQLKLTLYHNVVRQESRSKKLKEALTFFDQKSFDVMLIKGAALDVLIYDQPWYTVSYDVDIVLRVRKEEVSNEAQLEIMKFLHNSGIEYDYFEHHDIVMNGTLPVDFRLIWDNATKIKLGHQTVFVMSLEDMLISLCINSCRKRFFRLKALCDIAETIDKCPDLKWPNLIEKAKAYHCQAIVYTALLVANLTVGCQLPDEVLEGLNIGFIRTKIIQYLTRRMSLSAFSSLYSAQHRFLGRSIDFSLILPYFTYRWYQIWRRIIFASLFTEGGARRIKIWHHG